MMFECIDKIYPSVSIDTVTGSICNFTDNIGGLPLKSCTSLISAYQEGSGTPSPDNVRTINGWNAINISHSGADTSSPTVYTIQIGSTVYGGEYDARTGECKSEFANDRLDSKTWSYNSGRGAFNTTFLGKDQSRFREMICSCYTNGGIIHSASEVAYKPDKAFYTQPSSDSVFIKDSDYTDPTAWLNALGSNTLLYPLSTPQTIQLPPCLIDTLLGENNIFADCGDTTVEYIKIV